MYVMVWSGQRTVTQEAESVKIFREKTDLKMARTWQLSPVGCVKAMWRYATRRAPKQKCRLLRLPDCYQYSNEIALIR